MPPSTTASTLGPRALQYRHQQLDRWRHRRRHDPRAARRPLRDRLRGAPEGAGAGAEMATFDGFTVASFGGREILVATTPQRCEQMAKLFKENGIKPEWEVFSPEHILQDVTRLIQKGYDKPPYFINLVLGGDARFPGRDALHRRHPPDDGPHAAAADDLLRLRHRHRAAARDDPGILLGGHVRVGLEDNIYYAQGRRDQRAARGAHGADPARTRARAGLTGRGPGDDRAAAPDRRYRRLANGAIPNRVDLTRSWRNRRCVWPSSAAARQGFTPPTCSSASGRRPRSPSTNRTPRTSPSASGWSSPTGRWNSWTRTIRRPTRRSCGIWRSGRTSSSGTAMRSSGSTGSGSPRSAGCACCGSCRSAPAPLALSRSMAASSPASTSSTAPTWWSGRTASTPSCAGPRARRSAPRFRS